MFELQTFHCFIGGGGWFLGLGAKPLKPAALIGQDGG